MDDITNQLNQILSDPQSMAQIQNIMSGLGLGNSDNTQTVQNNPPPTPQVDTSHLAGLLGNNNAQSSANANLDMVTAISKIAPLLNTVKQEDNSTRLLNALSPMLSAKRQEKIVQAVRILQLLKLMPLIKDSGMLSSILGGLF